MGVFEFIKEIGISMSMPLFLQEERLLEHMSSGVMMASKEYFLKEQNKQELTFQYKL